MKILFFVVLFFTKGALAQFMEVQWNDHFQKELRINCSAEDKMCENICSASSICLLNEGACRNCIGTSLNMNYFLSELGRSIQRIGIPINPLQLADLLKSQEWASLTSQDVYNVIDPIQSIRVIKKFEALCPPESVSQILFLRLNSKTREIKKADMVYCELWDHVEIFTLTSKAMIDVQGNNSSKN